MKKKSELFSRLTATHFSFIFLFNLFLFAFYTLFCLYMALQLVLAEHQDFFTGEFRYREGGIPYTLNRVFIPLYLSSGFVILYLMFFGKNRAREILMKFISILSLSVKEIKRYFLFLLIFFLVLTLIPGFTLLIKHLNTQYGFLDADSYMSLVAIMNRGDFNANYVPEGGLQFGKYYIITIPTLILTYIFGIANLVASYNLVITFLIFLIIVNSVFTFYNFFSSKEDRLIDGLGIILFISASLILVLRSVVFRSYFNYDAFLQAYTNGFYGSIGGMFLLSSTLFIFSYLFKQKKIDKSFAHVIFLITFLFGVMMVQGYFNFSFFFIPATGIILATIISRRSSLKETLKLFLLFVAYLIVSYGSFLAIDIFPRYSMKPVEKLNIISLGLIILYLISLLINRISGDIILKIFLKYRFVAILLVFLIPFYWHFRTVKNAIPNAYLFNFPLQIGVDRVYFFSLVLVTLVFGYFLCRVFKIILRNHSGLFFYLSVIFFPAVIFYVNSSNVRRSLPLIYPPYYEESRVVMDSKNPYVFDENGIRVTYNQYLVDVVKYFEGNNIHDMWFWLVSKTPASSIYEHGLLVRMLVMANHRLEGVTVTRVLEPSELDSMNYTAKTNTDINFFIKNIFEIELKTRYLEKEYKNRYVILDNYFPEKTLEEIDSSPHFKRVYENKLYKVYKMNYIDKENH